MDEVDIAIKREGRFDCILLVDYSFKNELKRFIFDTYSRSFGKDQANSESKLMTGVDIILERPNFHPSYEEWKYFSEGFCKEREKDQSLSIEQYYASHFISVKPHDSTLDTEQSDSKFCMISVSINDDQLTYRESFNGQLQEWILNEDEKDKLADRNWETAVSKSIID